jgi:hypothetical protein
VVALSTYDIPFEGVEKTILEWVEEAMELRHGEAGDPLGRIELPAYVDGRDGVLVVLRRVRVRLDRLEELQAKSRQALGRVDRVRASAEFEAEMAQDAALKKQADRGRDYTSSLQLKSEASLDSIDQKRTAHQSKRVQSIASEAYDVIKGCYWGMDKIRTELLEMLKVHQSFMAVEGQTT